MASLQTLRNKGGVIVAGVIGLALLSFVLGDMLTSGSTLFGTGNEVGKINGTTITAEQYNQQINTLTEVVKVSSGTETISEEQNNAIQQQAWEQLVLRYAVLPQMRQIGITTGVAEMAELLTGRYVSPMVQQLFTDPQLGVYDPSLLRQFVANISMDQTGRLQLFWDNLQNEVSNQSQIQKYKVLIDNGAYVTSQEADFLAGVESSQFNITFVGEKLTSIADSTITVTQGEVKDYYNANQDAFKRAASRDIEYVVFDALPSTKDYADAEKYISELKAEFEAATDVKQFASLNSYSPFDSRYYKEGELPSAELNEFAFSSTTEDIYAPEMSADQYTMTRIADVKQLPDSIEFAHILFAPDQKATADSVLKAIQSGSLTFADAAMQFSLDQQTAALGGSYGKLDPQMLPQELGSELLAMGANKTKLIELPTSIHIAKVGEVKGMNKRVQLATITYSVEPSETTRAIAFNKASNFANQATGGNFSKAAQDSMLSKRVASLNALQPELQGYEGSREVIRWAYNNEVGQSSDVMEFGDSFLVLSLTGATQEGVAPLNKVSSQIQMTLINDKKGEMLAQKMAGKSVSDLATELGTSPIEGTEINFSTMIVPEFNFDPTFAGGIAGLQQGATSKPIVGMAAVYVANVNEVTSNPVSSSMVKERVEAQLQQGTFYAAYQTLMENSSITDTRYKFF